MSENAVAEPLSGSEVIEALKFKIVEQLARDCYLSPNSAYEYFKAEIKITVTAVDCGRPARVEKTVEVQKGSEEALHSGKGYKVESTEEIKQQPPNVVRRETEQNVPITVADGAGKTEQKSVKYQRKQRPAAPSKGVRTPVGATDPKTPAA